MAAEGSSDKSGRLGGAIADADDGRRIGVDWPDKKGSAGVDGGGTGPGGLSESTLGIVD